MHHFMKNEAWTAIQTAAILWLTLANLSGPFKKDYSVAVVCQCKIGRFCSFWDQTLRPELEVSKPTLMGQNKSI